MANMSYCRFENTASAMKDCLSAFYEALDEGMTLDQFSESLSSEQERRAFDRIITMAIQITQTFEEMKELM